jgi:asparagine synthetase B (glutamine-hydrolysing)
MFVHLRHNPSTGTTMELRAGVQQKQVFDLGMAGRLTLLGDPVPGVTPDQLAAAVAPRGRLDPSALLRTVRGHYHWFLEHEGGTALGSGFAALFPLYRRTMGHTTEVSSSMDLLAGLAPATPDRTYLLERLLFNYPLFDRTPWKEVQLLPAHQVLHVGPEGARLEKHLHIGDLIGREVRGDKAALVDLCERFAAECALFLPNDRVGISLTGGFDGRTLLAAARHAGHADLFTYSFGMPGEEDLTFPQALSSRLGITHVPIALDETYVEQHALRAALAFMDLGERSGNLGRAHYHYAAEVLAQRTRHILTGNFGSELFRAMHQPGVMMSSTLLRLFAPEHGDWKADLAQRAAAGMEHEAGELIASVERWMNAHPDASAAERFHIFLLEELFRKYFGPELVMQARLLRNRTPYLSLPLVEAVNATRWSGVHSALFEGRRARRMKGQVFYAAFLRRTDSALYRAPTNKGYTPADVLEPWRAPLLLAKVLLRRLRHDPAADSNAVHALLLQHGPALAAHYGLPSGTFGGEALTTDLERTISSSSALAAWNAAHGASHTP